MLKKLLCNSQSYQKRIDSCNKCPHKTKLNTCSLCGCVLPLKARFMFSDCPDKRWDENYFSSEEW
jgi:hypothetical protein